MSTNKFAEEVMAFKNDLTPFAISLTHNVDDAQDLYQETLYKALSNEDKFNKNTNLKAWLFTIMKNIFINNYRKLVKKREVYGNVADKLAVSKNSNVNKGYANLRLSEINRAIDDLSEIYRVPFQMYYAGFKYQEIADELNEPLGTIKSRIHLARKQLKSVLER